MQCSQVFKLSTFPRLECWKVVSIFKNCKGPKLNNQVVSKKYVFSIETISLSIYKIGVVTNCWRYALEDLKTCLDTYNLQYGAMVLKIISKSTHKVV